MIKLEKINKKNYEECLKLKVADNQIQFVLSNTHSLAKAYVYYHVVTPFAIYNDEIMVGFIMLRKVDDGYFIDQFMIDERYQMKGYGKKAMKEVIEQMKKDKTYHKVYLIYKYENSAAANLYSQLGFKITSRSEEYKEVYMEMGI